MAGINIPVGIKNAGFKAGLDEMRGQAKRFGSDLKSTFAGALGFGAVLAGITAMIKKGGDLKDLSERFDASAEALQRIGNVAAQNGSSIEGVGDALNKVALAQEEVKKGSEEQTAALATLKIEASEFINLDQEGAFMRIADAVANAEDRNAAYAAVIKLMGRNSGELFTTLEMGSDAIRELGNSIGIMSDDTIDRLDELGDAIDKAKNRFAVSGGSLILWVDRVARSVGASAAGIENNFRRMMNGLPKDDSGYNEAMAEIWNPKATERKPRKARNLDPQEAKTKGDSEAAKALQEEQRIEEEIAKLWEEARLHDLSLAKQIAYFEEKRQQLLLEGMAHWNKGSVEALTNERERLEIEKTITGLKDKQNEAALATAEKEKRLREEKARVLAESLKTEIDMAKEDRLRKMNPQQRVAELTKERDAKYTEAALLNSQGRAFESSQARIDAAELQRRIEGERTDPAKDAPERARTASVVVDSLQSVGGGGGAYGGGNGTENHLKEGNRYLSLILGELRTGKVQTSRIKMK